MLPFDKLLQRKNKEPAIIPSSEAYLHDLQGPSDMPPGAMPMDPMMFGGGPQIGSLRDSMEMVGLAGVTIDNKEIVEEFRAKLRGYKLKKTYDPRTGEEKTEPEKFGEPFCNDDGINELSGDLAIYTSKIWILSNIPKNESNMIKNIIFTIALDTSFKIAMNTRKWNVDKTRRSTILDLFVFTIYSNIMRGYDDGERTKLYPTQRHMTSTSIMPGMMQPEKKSIFGF